MITLPSVLRVAARAALVAVSLTGIRLAAIGEPESVAGTWRSNHGSVTLLHAPSVNGQPVVVTGSWDQGGGRIGEIRGGSFTPASGALEFRYYQPWNSATGIGRFNISADGTMLIGTYAQDGGTSGAWNMELVARATPFPAAEPAAPTFSPMPAAGELAIAGSWASPVGSLTLEHPPLAGGAVMVAGTWITPQGRAYVTRGTYDPGQHLLVFAFTQEWDNASGQARLSVSPDGSRLSGSYALGGGADTALGFARQSEPVVPLPAAAPPAAAVGLAAVLPPPVRSIAGVWDSSFGAVTLQQDPVGPGGIAPVRGYHDESPGRRAEIREGWFDPATGALEFTFFQPWRNLTGTGRFALAPGDAQLTGTYSQPGRTGAWNLTRRGGPPAIAPATPAGAPARSIAGTWNSKLGTVTLQHAPATGTGPVAVVGFHDESRNNRAELRDGRFDPVAGTLEFTYFQPWRNVTGTGRFVLSADNNKLTGTYSQPGATGPWNLERAGVPSASPAPGASAKSAARPADSPGAQLAVAIIGALLGGATQQPAAPPQPAPAPAATGMPSAAPETPVVAPTPPAAPLAPEPMPAFAPAPAPVAQAGARAVAIAAKSEYTLVLRDDGTVWAYGNNDTGGHVHQGKPRPAVAGTPVQISELTDIVAIAGGEIHAMALDRHGAVWVWGENQNGERGDGNPAKNASKLPPSRVEGLPPIATICAGGSNGGWSGVCVARGLDGSFWQWGRRIDAPPANAPRDGTYLHRRPKPETLAGFPSGAETIVGGTNSLLIVQRGGGLLRWGQRDSYFPNTPPQPTAVPGLSGIVAVGECIENTVAVARDGSVWGWGRGISELAIPQTEMGQEGVPVPLATTWKAPDSRAVAVGRRFAAILSGDGTVWVWGRNDYGQFGAGTVDKTIRSAPERVPGLSDVVAIASGDEHVVVLKNDGSVWGWGSGWSGRLGNANDSANYPTPLQPLIPAAAPDAVQAYAAHRAAYLAKLASLGN
jgi:alpha-tubulin suppressor-like RCC1 family protein